MEEAGNAMMKTFMVFVWASAAAAGWAQGCAPGCVPQGNTAAIDNDGTARITRVIPVPTTVSPEAQKLIGRRPGPAAASLEERRKATDAFRVARAAQARKLYPVRVEERTIGGVRTDVVSPAEAAEKQDRVLINVHGGGFVTDSGSLVEGIPIANLTGMRVVSVYYRLAPEHPFPAAVDDTVAVYREMLKTHRPEHIGLFGTSAGAILTAQTAVRLKQLGLPLPGALGVFSGLGDFSRWEDSRALFTLGGFGGAQPEVHPHPDESYVGKTDVKDPVLSPLFADLQGMPPTLFVTSGRDILLSGTTILHRAFLRAGAPAELVVFEALPHAFWYNYELPETKEALGIMAAFFGRTVGR